MSYIIPSAISFAIRMFVPCFLHDVVVIVRHVDVVCLVWLVGGSLDSFTVLPWWQKDHPSVEYET